MKTLCAAPALLCLLALAGCGDPTEQSTDTDARAAEARTVTLYTSVDDAFAKMVVEAFENETGIEVDVLGDTEATKTTGLVSRLQAEANDPVADVWWSSEPMGTILLARDGVLESRAMAGTVGSDWPEQLRADDWSWVGMAMRSRVIVYARDRVKTPPTTMAELAEPGYRKRIGMARPQFGTTRIHMALLADEWGPADFGAWLGALDANGVRLYDGNATVVRAVAMGEIDVGITDTDDVWAGQENGWEVALAYETPADHPRWPSAGPTLIPNTVGIVAQAPHPDAARELAAYLVSPAVERLLWESITHNTPVHPGLRAEFDASEDLLDISTLPNYRGASERVGAAMDLCERFLQGP